LTAPDPAAGNRTCGRAGIAVRHQSFPRELTFQHKLRKLSIKYCHFIAVERQARRPTLANERTKDARCVAAPIVSAAHLAESGLPTLSEVEFALTMTSNAFQRWIVRCMAASGQPGLSPVEDTHVITYAVKKLEVLGLIKTGKRKKEKIVATTPKGYALCECYRRTRNTLLVDSVNAADLDPKELGRLAALLRSLSGQYDQAARTATAA
jgi:predicted MarR family transcription regulator